ncbi:MAG TPA: FAD-dependent monooxygenase [Streptosporangiaceae bacterium]|jgi:2-polyprenyl-6-methoxyphenol hydroxylase-like FAD-dependent oxidoreductase|nr:FAD-dependent monooxygenase [Streptosporangiaceae bacterium]
MQNKDILISGAGIAGPALAYWLRQRGFNPTVVERAPAPRPGGQAVDLRGAGRTVVERMGLMDRVRAVGLDQRGIAFVDAKGRAKAHMPADAFGGEGIVSEIEVLRGDLGQVLYEATAGDTEYLFDDTITALDQDDTGASVTFEKAAPRRFGLVVGADGLHSAVRGLAFGPESACVQPIGCYTAWFTAPADFDLGGWFLMHNAPGGRVASARPGRLPGEVKAGLSFRSAPLPYDRRDLAAQRELLARAFAGVGWEVPRLLAAMHTAPDFCFDSMGQVRLDQWSAGRAVLLGDAGYSPTPLTGLGTSLALVGAYVLAGELERSHGDHVAAFRRYEEVMRPYVARGQEFPPGGVAGFAPSRRAVIRMRMISMRWMTRWPMRALIATQFAKAGDIALPDYPQPSRFPPPTPAPLRSFS